MRPGWTCAAGSSPTSTSTAAATAATPGPPAARPRSPCASTPRAASPSIPPIAVTSAGRDVDVIWSDFRGGTSYREIYSRIDTNFGQTWAAAEVRVNPTQNTDSFGIDLATEGTNVYVVYENVGIDRRSRH